MSTADNNWLAHASMLTFMSGAGFLILTGICQKAKGTLRRKNDEENKELIAELYRQKLSREKTWLDSDTTSSGQGSLSSRHDKIISRPDKLLTRPEKVPIRPEKTPIRPDPIINTAQKKSQKMKDYVDKFCSALTKWVGVSSATQPDTKIDGVATDAPTETNVNCNKVSSRSNRSFPLARLNSCGSHKQCSSSRASGPSTDVSDLGGKPEASSLPPRRRTVHGGTTERLCAKRKQKSPNRIPTHRSCQNVKFSDKTKESKRGPELTRRTFQDNLCAQVVKEYPFMVPYLKENVQTRLASTSSSKSACLLKEKRQPTRSPPHRKRPRLTIYQSVKSARPYQSPDSSDSSLVFAIPKKKINRSAMSLTGVKPNKTFNVNHVQSTPKKLVHTVRPNAVSASSLNSESSERSTQQAASQQIQWSRVPVGTSNAPEWPLNATQTFGTMCQGNRSEKEEISKDLKKAMVIPVPALRIQPNLASVTQSINSVEQIGSSQNNSTLTSNMPRIDQMRVESYQHMPYESKNITTVSNDLTGKTQHISSHEVVTNEVNTQIISNEEASTLVPCTDTSIQETIPVENDNIVMSKSDLECTKALNTFLSSKRFLPTSPKKDRPKKAKISRSNVEEKDNCKLVSISHEVLNLASLQSQSPPVRDNFRQRSSRRKSSVVTSSDNVNSANNINNPHNNPVSLQKEHSLMQQDKNDAHVGETSKCSSFCGVTSRSSVDIKLSQSQLLRDAFSRQYTPPGLQLLSDASNENWQSQQFKQSFTDLSSTKSIKTNMPNSSPSKGYPQNSSSVRKTNKNHPQTINTNSRYVMSTPKTIISRDKLHLQKVTSPRKPLHSPLDDMQNLNRYRSLTCPRIPTRKAKSESKSTFSNTRKTRSYQPQEKRHQVSFSGITVQPPGNQTAYENVCDTFNFKKGKTKNELNDTKRGRLLDTVSYKRAPLFTSNHKGKPLPIDPSSRVKRPTKTSRSNRDPTQSTPLGFNNRTRVASLNGFDDTGFTQSMKMKLANTLNQEQIEDNKRSLNFPKDNECGQSVERLGSTAKHNVKKRSKSSNPLNTLQNRNKRVTLSVNKNPQYNPRCFCLLRKNIKSAPRENTMKEMNTTPIYSSRNNSHSPSRDKHRKHEETSSIKNKGVIPITDRDDNVLNFRSAAALPPPNTIMFSDQTNFKSKINDITLDKEDSDSSDCTTHSHLKQMLISTSKTNKTMPHQIKSLDISAKGENGLPNGHVFFDDDSTILVGREREVNSSDLPEHNITSHTERDPQNPDSQNLLSSSTLTNVANVSADSSLPSSSSKGKGDGNTIDQKNATLSFENISLAKNTTDMQENCARDVLVRNIVSSNPRSMKTPFIDHSEKSISSAFSKSKSMTHHMPLESKETHNRQKPRKTHSRAYQVTHAISNNENTEYPTSHLLPDTKTDLNRFSTKDYTATNSVVENIPSNTQQSTCTYSYTPLEIKNDNKTPQAMDADFHSPVITYSNLQLKELDSSLDTKTQCYTPKAIQSISHSPIVTNTDSLTLQATVTAADSTSETTKNDDTTQDKNTDYRSPRNTKTYYANMPRNTDEADQSPPLTNSTHSATQAKVMCYQAPLIKETDSNTSQAIKKAAYSPSLATKVNDTSQTGGKAFQTSAVTKIDSRMPQVSDIDANSPVETTKALNMPSDKSPVVQNSAITTPDSDLSQASLLTTKALKLPRAKSTAYQTSLVGKSDSNKPKIPDVMTNSPLITKKTYSMPKAKRTASQPLVANKGDSTMPQAHDVTKKDSTTPQPRSASYQTAIVTKSESNVPIISDTGAHSNFATKKHLNTPKNKSKAIRTAVVERKLSPEAKNLYIAFKSPSVTKKADDSSESESEAINDLEVTKTDSSSSQATVIEAHSPLWTMKDPIIPQAKNTDFQSQKDAITNSNTSQNQDIVTHTITLTKKSPDTTYIDNTYQTSRATKTDSNDSQDTYIVAQKSLETKTYLKKPQITDSAESFHAANIEQNWPAVNETPLVTKLDSNEPQTTTSLSKIQLKSNKDTPIISGETSKSPTLKSTASSTSQESSCLTSIEINQSNKSLTPSSPSTSSANESFDEISLPMAICNSVTLNSRDFHEKSHNKRYNSSDDSQLESKKSSDAKYNNGVMGVTLNKKSKVKPKVACVSTAAAKLKSTASVISCIAENNSKIALKSPLSSQIKCKPPQSKPWKSSKPKYSTTTEFTSDSSCYIKQLKRLDATAKQSDTKICVKQSGTLLKNNTSSLSCLKKHNSPRIAFKSPSTIMAGNSTSQHAIDTLSTEHKFFSSSKTIKTSSSQIINTHSKTVVAAKASSSRITNHASSRYLKLKRYNEQITTSSSKESTITQKECKAIEKYNNGISVLDKLSKSKVSLSQPKSSPSHHTTTNIMESQNENSIIVAVNSSNNTDNINDKKSGNLNDCLTKEESMSKLNDAPLGLDKSYNGHRKDNQNICSTKGKCGTIPMFEKCKTSYSQLELQSCMSRNRQKYIEKTNKRQVSIERKSKLFSRNKSVSLSRYENTTTTVSLQIASKVESVARTKSASSLVSSFEKKSKENSPSQNQNNQITTATISINTNNMLPLEAGSTATITATFGAMVSSPRRHNVCCRDGARVSSPQLSNCDCLLPSIETKASSPQVQKSVLVPRTSPSTLSRSSKRSAKALISGVHRRRKQGMYIHGRDMDSLSKPPLDSKPQSQKISLGRRVNADSSFTDISKQNEPSSTTTISDSSLSGYSPMQKSIGTTNTTY